MTDEEFYTQAKRGRDHARRMLMKFIMPEDAGERVDDLRAYVLATLGKIALDMPADSLAALTDCLRAAWLDGWAYVGMEAVETVADA